MKYRNAAETAKDWNIAERSVRDYCAKGRVTGAVFDGKTWKIPVQAQKPSRKQRKGKISSNLLTRLKNEMDTGLPGGIYHRVQIDLTYNSNHIEGSQLSHDQTRYIFETNTIGMADTPLNVDDIIETANHFRCVGQIIAQANYPLSETMIRQLHMILKSGTSDSRKPWFAVGEWKREQNEVGGMLTTPPEKVGVEMKNLLSSYRSLKTITLQDILAFHWNFERIHPFQDGNGRIGRLIMFKECLRNGITPFIIEDDLKLYYYRGIKEWAHEPGFLMDTCLTAQDRFKVYLDHFGIAYND